MDVYSIITERIIKGLEAGNIPWKKPWNGSGPRNFASGHEYSGINVMLLPGLCASIKQINELGGSVKAGSKANIAVFWKMLPTIDKETGKAKNIPLLRYYNVFSLDQTNGLDVAEITKKYAGVSETPAERIAHCEEILHRKQPVIKQELSTRAFYSPRADEITLPALEQFHSSAGYYETAFHELIHWTGHKSRLDRIGADHMEKHSYSREELVAEIGAAFLLNKAGIEPTEPENVQAYINSWIRFLKDAPREIVTAAGKAQKAARYITEDQPAAVTDEVKELVAA